jgi:hypothetical protein
MIFQMKNNNKTILMKKIKMKRNRKRKRKKKNLQKKILNKKWQVNLCHYSLLKNHLHLSLLKKRSLPKATKINKKMHLKQK